MSKLCDIRWKSNVITRQEYLAGLVKQHKGDGSSGTQPE